MKKMALLDWRAMKCYHLRMLLIPVTALAAGIVTPLFTVPVSVFLFLLFSVNTFAVEEKADLNRLYLTLPVKRSAIVAGRYALSFCLGIAGMLTGIPVAMVADRFTMSHYYGPIGWFLPVAAVSYLLFSLFGLFMFPVLFRFGYGKGKFWGMLLPVLLFSAFYTACVMILFWPGNERMLFNALEYAGENPLLVNGGIAAAATLILFLSLLLSQRLYMRREF